MITMNADFTEIIKYAAKAPSGHNSQPWKFKITNEGIAILPDYRAALPVVDKDNRELFISLGCAAENIVVSATFYGYESKITERGEAGINITLSGNSEVKCDELFYSIEKRQTNRNVYSGDKIAAKALETLESTVREPGVRIYFSETGSVTGRLLKEYVALGNAVQMNDKGFKNELLSWMRFNAKHERTMNDGLSYRVFGNPPLPKFIARPIVSCFLKPDVQNKSDMKKIESSSHLVMLTIQNNTHEGWIDLGRTLQRLLLNATKSGISCAFINQPCEVRALAAELQNKLTGFKGYPALILRMGYAGPAPYSPRRKNNA